MNSAEISTQIIVPTAANDSYSTAEDTALDVIASGVLMNDTDAGNNPLTAMIVSGPSNAASFTLNADGSFSYTPAANFNGQDSFTYKANAGSLDSNTATVTITVSEVNDAPTTENDSKSTDEDTTLIFNAADLTGNDSAGPPNESAQTLSVSIVISTANMHGIVSLNNGQITYQPSANYNGATSFDYEVCDNGTTDGAADAKCAVGTVNVTVNAVNDAPTITAASGISRQQGADISNSQIAVVSDVDNAATTLTVTVNGSTSATVDGVTVSNIAVDANGNVTADISASQSATNASFTLRVSDGSLSSMATLNVTVTQAGYNFTGFFSPIEMGAINTAKAGSAIPVKFSLGGNQGLNIFAPGYPACYQIPCSGTGDNGGDIPTDTSGSSTLTYDAEADQYKYVWKTEKNWKGSCRRLVVKLNDGSTHTADFQFK